MREWSKELLLKKLKENGLDAAEEAAKGAIKGVFEFVEESIKLSSNKLDDLALPVVSIIKEKVLKKVDEIDGEVG